MRALEQILPRTIARVSLSTVKRNFALLATGWDGAVPMVKCNAYGHGMIEVARVLETSAKTRAFGVATLEEGVRLRRAGVKAPIWVFSDCGPWSDTTSGLIEAFRLTPVLHSTEDVKAILKPRYKRLLASQGVHLKFNTGMNRLGIPLTDLEQVRRLFLKAGVTPEGLCSHLAIAEDATCPPTRAQVAGFEQVVSSFAGQVVSHIHCSNTAAMLSESQLHLSKLCNVARPGIGLYGYGGRAGEKLGLRPALEWRARVVSSRVVSRGEIVGYGGTFRAQKRTPQSVLAIGYGDGLKRILSNGEILVRAAGSAPKRVRLLGRVSMDLTSINIRLKPGSWVTLLGEGAAQGEMMASQAQTIVYEILTSISSRVPRQFL